MNNIFQFISTLMGLNWTNETNLESFSTFFGFLLTLIAIFFTWREFRRNQKIQKAQFIMNITERYFNNDEVRQFYYTVDYGTFKFEPSVFRFSPQERCLDSLLYTFDTIGRLVKLGVINIKDVEILAFQARRILNNSEVKKYLATLHEDYGRDGITKKAHEDALYLVDAFDQYFKST